MHEMNLIEQLEENMELLGITGVEDILQEDIQQTLQCLKNGGIHIWMLTGDKLETSTCIAISTGFKSPQDQIFTIKDIEDQMQLVQQLNEFSRTQSILVIDGISLTTALQYKEKFFFEIAASAKAVICCRCTPTQKSIITEGVKRYTRKITLAIGDGGNDVGMIQTAHIGIGIVGKEGKQAALASDYSILKFKYLAKLVLFHGRLNYKRTAVMSQFVLHRGTIISVIQAIFNYQHNEDHQRLMWDLLRKSINGIVNKINVSNIQNVIIELLNENILRGKGLFARAVVKAQMSSPNFTHVYAALIAIINTKLPDIVNLIIRRVLLQFQRSFKRNNKLVCQAALKMIAHLINQNILTDYIGLQLLLFFLENPTEDTVELACEFMIECGQVLSELSPVGVNAIFERFKGILHEGECEKRVQYNIEHLFAVRKTKFKVINFLIYTYILNKYIYQDHSGIIPELDLVEQADQITHNFDLLDQFDPEDNLNQFKFDPFYEKTEEEWEQIKLEILGEDNILQLKQIKVATEEKEEQIDEENIQIKNLTEEDRANLRRTLYLTIMSSVDFEECCHKVLKMNLGVGHENEVCSMIQECCQNERTYMKFYGLLAQRFCQLSELYRDNFMKCFIDLYATIHRYETAKIRNSAKYYAHLFYTDSIDWRVFACISLTQESTTASSRIFIRNLVLEIQQRRTLGIFLWLVSKRPSKKYKICNKFFYFDWLRGFNRAESMAQQQLEIEEQQKQNKESSSSSVSENEEESSSSSDSSSSSEESSNEDSNKSSSIESNKKKKQKKK
ncbi:pre-mRNA-splicing factor cwc-22, putative [Ichthyophthirius multifiliis]|uniref:P-type phospholipid transporter n=1 Tax=Ichthyophthirius multifiliis TaxID=5932 RepID=G0QTW9_ICHMU|nr:pre-mRNA-splicing factor cwc-22, putative [Ichthyophthirius multifiliis]EGR31328.1 pre-mRNA-splicing factor cwc-22, putative [Ichthyophthirius multifiliis]|eukprot:XP_004034814.1 pre-mRNA-splicing factor cwc-22, putative [Ichthyophthirius multifiliis]